MPSSEASDAPWALRLLSLTGATHAVVACSAKPSSLETSSSYASVIVPTPMATGT